MTAMRWDRVARGDADECWLWTGQIQRGYGRFCVWQDGKAKTIQAHRAAYEEVIGPIPEGLQIDHLCRNRACVNPSHLEAVSPRINTLRGETFPARNAQKTHCPLGHPYDLFNTYVTPQGSRNCRKCKNAKRMRLFRRARGEAS